MLRTWILAPLLMAAAAQAAPSKFIFTYNGSDCGSSTYERAADGTISGSMSFEIGPQKQAMSISGLLVDGLLSELNIQSKTGNTPVVIVLKNGKVTARVNGKDQGTPRDFAMTTRAMVSAFLPQMTGDLFNEWKKNDKPKQIDIVFLDSVVQLKVPISSKTHIANRNNAKIALTILSVTLNTVEIQYGFTDKGELVGMNVPTQKFGAYLEGWSGVFTSPVLKYKELSQPTFGVTKESGAISPMRDGVKLQCDVVRPKMDGAFPVILVRTPYGRKSSSVEGEFWAQRGYVFVTQDVRGMGESEGQFNPLVNEVADGKDTLDWLVKQPWCNGKVGMIGGSYLGYVQWAAASTHHPSLKCIVPQVSPPPPTMNFPWDHGAFMLAPNVWWCRVVKDKVADLSGALSPVKNTESLFDLPISRVEDAMLGKDIPFYNDWVKRPNPSDWPTVFQTADIARISIPVLHISGIWDGDGIGTKIHWQLLRQSGNNNQSLVFGPWTHFFNSSSSVGGFDYGKGAILELDSLYLRFFDTHLKGMAVNWEKQPKVRMFVTGSNTWLTGPDWPVPQAKFPSLMLGGTQVTGKNSKGRLVGFTPNPGSGSYVYDPNHLSFKPKDMEVGQQTGLLIKASAIPPNSASFRSSPFKSPTIVTGPIRAELFVSTTAKDATFHAAVVDVYPNGDARVLGMPGTKRIWYELGKQQPIVPNKVYKITIEPWQFAHQFEPGHSLGLFITSDMFPQFARNPGTGEPDWKATKLVKAKHTLHWGPKYPSRLWYSTIQP